LNELPCYYAVGDDGGGHQHNLLSYVNASQKRGSEPGPGVRRANWRNSVSLLNRCTRRWELVYQHDFVASQKDCSVDSSCGWWGPIVETFNASPQPAVKELGFLETTLRYDRGVSTLKPSDTDFFAPNIFEPNTAWSLFHLDPDRSWGIGSSTAN
jgi:hypothetical protein